MSADFFKVLKAQANQIVSNSKGKFVTDEILQSWIETELVKAYQQGVAHGRLTAEKDFIKFCEERGFKV